MVLLSRAFVRKRMISLATTASVAATSFALAQDPTRTHHAGGEVQYAADRQEDSEKQSLLSASAAAMQTMADTAMKPTGDVDRDLVEMMPHQGAVDMAKAKLDYGGNEQFRRLVQRIAATRPPEITLMQDAVSDGKSSVAQLPEQSRGVLRNWVRLAARSTMTE